MPSRRVVLWAASSTLENLFPSLLEMVCIQIVTLVTRLARVAKVESLTATIPTPRFPPRPLVVKPGNK